MSKAKHTLETSRLEIILLAVAVFVLVSLLAILILVCVSLKHSPLPAANYPDGHDGTAWGGSWSERLDAGRLSPYHDHVRRRCGCAAEDARREFASFETLVPVHITNEEATLDQSIADGTMCTGPVCQTGKQALEYIMMNPDGSKRGDSESSASSSAREQTLETATRRLERIVPYDEDFDLEAQDHEDSDS